MNRQQILSRLAKFSDVIYTNGAWFSWQRNQAEWKRAASFGRLVQEDGVWQDAPPKWLLRWTRWPWWDRQALELHGVWLRRQLAQWGDSPVVQYIFHPMFSDYVGSLRSDILVYHAYDLFHATPGWTHAHAAGEEKLLRSADVVFASSAVIAKALRERVDREIIIIPNAADVRAFSSVIFGENVPLDLVDIPSPRIGYIGNINRKVDFSLVEYLARRNRAWQFVFVGGVGNFDEETRACWERCQELDNIHFLGAKERSELPQYVAGMDVNIMCYRRGKGIWTEGGYPLKLHEYLAVGKPVVATDLPTLAEFSNVLDLAGSPAQWEEKLNAALSGKGAGSLTQRRAVAAMNDWDDRVRDIDTHLRQAMARRGA